MNKTNNSSLNPEYIPVWTDCLTGLFDWPSEKTGQWATSYKMIHYDSNNFSHHDKPLFDISIFLIPNSYTPHDSNGYRQLHRKIWDMLYNEDKISRERKIDHDWKFVKQQTECILNSIGSSLAELKLEIETRKFPNEREILQKRLVTKNRYLNDIDENSSGYSYLKFWSECLSEFLDWPPLKIRLWSKQFQDLGDENSSFYHEVPLYYLTNSLVPESFREVDISGSRIRPYKEFMDFRARICDAIEGGDYYCGSRFHFDWNAAKKRVERVLNLAGSSLEEVNQEIEERELTNG